MPPRLGVPCRLLTSPATTTDRDAAVSQMASFDVGPGLFLPDHLASQVAAFERQLEATYTPAEFKLAATMFHRLRAGGLQPTRTMYISLVGSALVHHDFDQSERYLRDYQAQFGLPVRPGGPQFDQTLITLMEQKGHENDSIVLSTYDLLTRHGFTIGPAARSRLVSVFCHHNRWPTAAGWAIHLLGTPDHPVSDHTLKLLLDRMPYEAPGDAANTELCHSLARAANRYVERYGFVRNRNPLLYRLMRINNHFEMYASTCSLWQKFFIEPSLDDLKTPSSVTPSTSPVNYPKTSSQDASADDTRWQPGFNLQPWHRATVQTIALVTEAIGYGNNVQTLPELIRYCLTFRVQLHSVNYRHLVVAFCRHGDVESAVRVLTYLVPRAVVAQDRPSRYAITTILRLARLQGRNDIGWDLEQWLVEAYPSYAAELQSEGLFRSPRQYDPRFPQRKHTTVSPHYIMKLPYRTQNSATGGGSRIRRQEKASAIPGNGA
ncbi:hypothetical protein IWQ60_002568 [Tieghemiomyces parasiticus]|uniref:Uncharacterized protein n=1 Tax=Tieghemiomyces parasiticus TaxID=78921 RepID=A0A9W8AB36_9FUNG|nr:hypothetical protein IWQ60_002568 [Tieghemiomyces parasiticus]